MLIDDIYYRRTPSSLSRHRSAGFPDENHDPTLSSPIDPRSTLQSSLPTQITPLLIQKSTPLSALAPSFLNRSHLVSSQPTPSPVFNQLLSAPATPTPSYPPSPLSQPDSSRPHQGFPTADKLLDQFRAGLIERQISAKNAWELQCRECTSWVRTGVSATIHSFDRRGYFMTLQAHMAGKDCGGARSSVAREASPLSTPSSPFRWISKRWTLAVGITQ
ncbi:hypothetical protein HGRIS_011860 [Hohenbuehelia grisea]|uniref:Uncharacterized protein n=1 Tax=Hohenbuehelia grisea TaxID=104357 RepID=A0ABR3JWJ7_9AGAR